MTHGPADAPVPDLAVMEVVEAWKAADPGLLRTKKIVRESFDQIYDGRRTGRYSWDDLYKTERTHFGTVLEINLRHEFTDIITDGDAMDYKIAGHDVDLKYSQKTNGWMIPLEARGHLLLVAHANDAWDKSGQKKPGVQSTFELGVVRAREEWLVEPEKIKQRDKKCTLRPPGYDSIVWIAKDEPFAENTLLAIDPATRADIMSKRSGQARITELLLQVQNRKINRATVETLGKQKDPMKRIRKNGGSRDKLDKLGLLVLSGDRLRPRQIARELGVPIPDVGGFVVVRIVEAVGPAVGVSKISGRYWRCAAPDEEAASLVPEIENSEMVTEEDVIAGQA